MTTIRKLSNLICGIMVLLLALPLLYACDRSSDSVLFTGEEEEAVTRIALDRIVTATALEANDEFGILIYSKNPLVAGGGYFYTAVDCKMTTSSEYTVSAYYPHLVTTKDDGIRKELLLPSGTYRLYTYMTPQEIEMPTTDIEAFQLLFSRGTDLMVAVNDIVVETPTSVNPDAKVSIPWDNPFKHQSSQIVFQVKHKTPSGGVAYTYPIKVEEVAFSQLYETGVCTMSLNKTIDAIDVLTVSPAIDDERKGTITLKEDAEIEGAVFEGNNSTMVTTYPFLLIPSENIIGMRVKVKLSCESLNGFATLSAITKQFTFEPGMKYTFTLEIDPDRPELICTVKEWLEDTNGNGGSAEIGDDGIIVSGSETFVVEEWETGKNHSENNVGG